MKIEFEKIETSVLPHFKDGEKEYRAKMFVDANNRIMKGTLIPGASIGMHTHTSSSETIFITAGKGHVIEDGQISSVKAGDCLYCPQGSSHSLVNDSNEDLNFFAVVPEHMKA